VVEKFHKLKAALMVQREKAEKAEDRANSAETLAGKGSFNKETTRILHLRDNPLSLAIREKHESEIKSLQKEVEALRSHPTPNSVERLSSSSSAVTPCAGGDLDAQKLHSRLRQQFKDQISLYREGVYLITGWRVEMYNDSERPRFKARHIYAERETDHLMFGWPEVEAGMEVKMLDMFDTEAARDLSQDEMFQYVTKFKSMPAFMASLTLSLFENQTQMNL